MGSGSFVGQSARTCERSGSNVQTSRVERLLRILRGSPLASMPVPDAYKKIQAYDQIRRGPREVIGDYIVREQRAFREMTEALRRVRNSRNEKIWSTTLRSSSHLGKLLCIL